MEHVDVGLRKYKQIGYIVLYWMENGRKIVRHTGETVPVKDWDAARRRPRNNIDQAMRVDAMRVDVMRNGPKALPKNQYRKTSMDFLSWYETLILERASRPGEYARETIQSYRRTLRKLQRFCREKGRKTLPFHAFSLDFLSDFLGWMYASAASVNYAAKTIGHLRDAMQEAEACGIASATDFRSKRLRIRGSQPASEPIYLTLEEIEKLAAVKLPRGLGRARDAFLIRCYTGLRFSDGHKVRESALSQHRGGDVLRVVAQKTKKETAIPVSNGLRKLLEKYPDGTPIHSRQYENKAIKIAAKKAGIARWKYITTHTARRSFATNEYLLAIEQGRSHLPIMRALGHSSEKMFFRYIRLDALENAQHLRVG